jgi:hypothetical protein
MLAAIAPDGTQHAAGRVLAVSDRYHVFLVRKEYHSYGLELVSIGYLPKLLPASIMVIMFLTGI